MDSNTFDSDRHCPDGGVCNRVVLSGVRLAHGRKRQNRSIDDHWNLRVGATSCLHSFLPAQHRFSDFASKLVVDGLTVWLLAGVKYFAEIHRRTLVAGEVRCSVRQIRSSRKSCIPLAAAWTRNHLKASFHPLQQGRVGDIGLLDDIWEKFFGNHCRDRASNPCLCQIKTVWAKENPSPHG